MIVEFRKNVLGGWPELSFCWNKKIGETGPTLAAFLETVRECFPGVSYNEMGVDAFSDGKVLSQVGIVVHRHRVFEEWLENQKKERGGKPTAT